jgi:hypothetical protein
VEYVLVALPALLALAWTVRRYRHRRSERARLARIRASVEEWLTPEWAADDPVPDVAAEEPPKPVRRFDPGSGGYHRGRSA